VSRRAREAHAHADLRTPYWDWTARDGKLHYQKYAGTPPEHLMFALRQALDMLFEEGLENVFLRHRLLAEAVRRAIGRWSEGHALGFNIADAKQRADTVTTVVMNGDADPRQLVDYCNNKCGVVLGIGIGELSGKAFRIAHMGHVNAPMILGISALLRLASTPCGYRTAWVAYKPRSTGLLKTFVSRHPREAEHGPELSGYSNISVSYARPPCSTISATRTFSTPLDRP
jgi:aspartate aminotransferase-like enzyme